MADHLRAWDNTHPAPDSHGQAHPNLNAEGKKDTYPYRHKDAPVRKNQNGRAVKNKYAKTEADSDANPRQVATLLPLVLVVDLQTIS